MRKIIAAMQISLDGFVEDANGKNDWVVSWEDEFDLLGEVDTFILGARMYPDYETYWRAIVANPTGMLPFGGRVANEGEVAYARFADRTTHVVLSTTMREASWPVTRIMRDVEAIRALKSEPGKAMHAVGGASLIGSLMNAGLVDELRVVVNPVVLGKGKGMFEHVARRQMLKPRQSKLLVGGQTLLTYDLEAR